MNFMLAIVETFSDMKSARGNMHVLKSYTNIQV
jgi:hypothetical protein